MTLKINTVTKKGLDFYNFRHFLVNFCILMFIHYIKRIRFLLIACNLVTNLLSILNQLGGGAYFRDILLNKVLDLFSGKLSSEELYLCNSCMS
jgi:hypothetical protein